MKKTVSRGQALEIMARVGTQIHWDKLNGNRLQTVIDFTPEEFGRRLTSFLDNNCRFIFGELGIVRPMPFDPKEFFGEGWAVWKGPADGDGLLGEDNVDSRLKYLDNISPADRFVFENSEGDNGKRSRGEHELQWLKSEKPKFIPFGAEIFLSLWENYQSGVDETILDWIYRKFRISAIFFMGTALRSPLGFRHVPCFYCDEYNTRQWRPEVRHLSGGWPSDFFSVGCFELSSEKICLGGII